MPAISVPIGSFRRGRTWRRSAPRCRGRPRRSRCAGAPSAGLPAQPCGGGSRQRRRRRRDRCLPAISTAVSPGRKAAPQRAHRVPAAMPAITRSASAPPGGHRIAWRCARAHRRCGTAGTCPGADRACAPRARRRRRSRSRLALWLAWPHRRRAPSAGAVVCRVLGGPEGATLLPR